MNQFFTKTKTKSKIDITKTTLVAIQSTIATYIGYYAYLQSIV